MRKNFYRLDMYELFVQQIESLNLHLAPDFVTQSHANSSVQSGTAITSYIESDPWNFTA